MWTSHKTIRVRVLCLDLCVLKWCVNVLNIYNFFFSFIRVCVCGAWSNIVYFSASLCFELHSRKEHKRHGCHSSEKWMRCRTRSVLRNTFVVDVSLFYSQTIIPPFPWSLPQFYSEISKLSPRNSMQYGTIYYTDKVQSIHSSRFYLVWLKVCVCVSSVPKHHTHIFIPATPPSPHYVWFTLPTWSTSWRYHKSELSHQNVVCLCVEELDDALIAHSVNHAQTHFV